MRGSASELGDGLLWAPLRLAGDTAAAGKLWLWIWLSEQEREDIITYRRPRVSGATFMPILPPTHRESLSHSADSGDGLEPASTWLVARNANGNNGTEHFAKRKLLE